MNDIENDLEKIPRREREKAMHRKEILDAAIKVFAEKGLFEATLDEIAQEAEFSKSALYLYFSNKEDIFFTILNGALEKWEEFRENTITGKKDFKIEITDFLKGSAKHLYENLDFFKILTSQIFNDFNGLSKENKEKLISKHCSLNCVFDKRIKKAIDDGELRNLDPEAVAYLFHGSIDNMFSTRWNCATLDELLKSIDLFMDIIFNGIAKKKEN